MKRLELNKNNKKRVEFVWELTKETIVLPLGCLQGGILANGEREVPGLERGVALGLARLPLLDVLPRRCFLA